MSNGSTGAGDLEFLQAVLKRGFVNIPRMIFDHIADLGLNYDTIGKMFAVMACVGGPGENALGKYQITRRDYPNDFDQLKQYILELEHKDELILSEDEGDHISFSFLPLFVRLHAFWHQQLENHEEEQQGSTIHPAILAAEKLLVNISDRAVQDIKDWIDTYGFESDMVMAVIREGQRLGVTRINYLNQIARQWFEEGIRTPEQAEEYVQRYRKSAGKHKVIIQYLGHKRPLTGAEQGLLDKWTQEWGFSNEVIFRACDLAIGKENPLQYVNKVLESWSERGVKTVNDVDQALREYKQRSAPEKGVRTTRKPAAKSNVFLQREKKDDDYYDYLYKDTDD